MGVAGSSPHRLQANDCLAMDNIFIERLWRSLKPEAVSLEELTYGFKAQRVIRDWMTIYNSDRAHSALERRTPKEAYWAGRDQKSAE